jgi:hypothetical protein
MLQVSIYYLRGTTVNAPALITVVQKDDQFYSFEQSKKIHPDGSVYWSARDLMRGMGYTKWEHFQVPLTRAMKSAENQKIDLTSQFPVSRNLAERVQGGGNTSLDYELTRFACYLIAMNGDPCKPKVAKTQAYFAIQTHFAESVQRGQLAITRTTHDEIGTKFDKTLTEFNRLVTPKTLESLAASSLAATLQNLSHAMLPTSLVSRNGKTKKTIESSSPSNGSSKSGSKSRAGEIPENLAPFVSQAGKPVVREYRERHIPISEDAEQPMTYPEFAAHSKLEPCGVCGQALSHRMTSIAKESGVPMGRFATRSVFPLDFWIEAWAVLSEHLERLHADHARNHARVSNV